MLLCLLQKRGGTVTLTPTAGRGPGRAVRRAAAAWLGLGHSLAILGWVGCVLGLQNLRDPRDGVWGFCEPVVGKVIKLALPHYT